MIPQQSIPSVSPAKLKSSFRDPSGFLFEYHGSLYRFVSHAYREQYDLLVSSGLAESLIEEGLLVPHREVSITTNFDDAPYKVIEPERIPFICFPQEWSFSQYKDAALLTLKIMERSLDRGMILKDATAYNVQFVGSRPIFIDTLSFERYEDGLPWVAYRQFCQHFLAPLTLMAKSDISLGRLMGIWIDGVPLELASRILPTSSWFSLASLIHIHMHARSQKRYAATHERPSPSKKLTKHALLALIDSLRSAVLSLSWNPAGTEWAEYYDNTNYSDESFASKARIIKGWVSELKPKVVWDLGANTGVFSEIATAAGAYTLSFDIDPAAVEKNYRKAREQSSQNMLPLVLDLTNPTPSYGWGEQERGSIASRANADCIFALALIHHLCISNNLPFSEVSDYFSSLGRYLIIEFVPKADSQVKRLLSTREDIFPEYDELHFEVEFSRNFKVLKKERIPGTERTLFLLEALT